MSVANKREIRELLSKANLPYHMIKGSDIKAQPPDVTPHGDQTVVLYDVDGNPLFILTPDMNAQAATAENVTVASAIIVAVDVNRRALTLVNHSDTAMDIAFDGNPAVANAGIRLIASGGTITLSRWGPLFTTGEVQARHSGVGNKIIGNLKANIEIIS